MFSCCTEESRNVSLWCLGDTIGGTVLRNFLTEISLDHIEEIAASLQPPGVNSLNSLC